ncbi:MAG: hypothetical protein QXN26_01585 [Thermoplasmataceae archaeon]
MDSRRAKIRELKKELHSMKTTAGTELNKMNAISWNERVDEIKSKIKSLRADLKENNLREYNDMTNRMNAIRSSYKAGGLNLGQYEHEDNEQR